MAINNVAYNFDEEVDLTSVASEILYFLKPWIDNPTIADNPLNFQPSKFCSFMLNIFEHQLCIDTGMISQILDLVFAIRRNDINNHMCAKSILWILLRRYNCSYGMKLYMKMPYMRWDNYCYFDPIRFALHVQDINLMKLLLRYGVAYLPLHDEKYQKSTVALGIYWILSFMGIPKTCQDKNNWVSSYLSHIFKLYPPPSRPRLFLLLTAISDVVREDPGRFKIQCIKMIFQTIPEPHISSDEIRKFLSCLLNRKTCDPDIRKVSDTFEKEFPENAKVYQPRSLKHLSRCMTRQSLRVAGTFPHGVHWLPLPDALKFYIMLMQRSDTFYVDWTHLIEE